MDEIKNNQEQGGSRRQADVLVSSSLQNRELIAIGKKSIRLYHVAFFFVFLIGFLSAVSMFSEFFSFFRAAEPPVVQNTAFIAYQDEQGNPFGPTPSNAVITTIQSNTNTNVNTNANNNANANQNTNQNSNSNVNQNTNTPTNSNQNTNLNTNTNANNNSNSNQNTNSSGTNSNRPPLNTNSNSNSNRNTPRPDGKSFPDKYSGSFQVSVFPVGSTSPIIRTVLHTSDINRIIKNANKIFVAGSYTIVIEAKKYNPVTINQVTFPLKSKDIKDSSSWPKFVKRRL